MNPSHKEIRGEIPAWGARGWGCPGRGQPGSKQGPGPAWSPGVSPGWWPQQRAPEGGVTRWDEKGREWVLVGACGFPGWAPYILIFPAPGFLSNPVGGP